MTGERRLHTSTVRTAHAYTRSKVPWLLESYGKKLFKYLSGGGLEALGRSVEQEEIDMQRTRFLAWSAVLAAIWLVFLLV